MKVRESLFQKRLLKTHLLSGLAFVIYAGGLQVTQIYSPIWYLTGWQMPTTGITRAWLQLLQGNVASAFEYHRLFLLAPVLAIAIYRYVLFEDRRDLILAIGCAIIFLVNNVMR